MFFGFVGASDQQIYSTRCSGEASDASEELILQNNFFFISSRTQKNTLSQNLVRTAGSLIFKTQASQIQIC